MKTTRSLRFRLALTYAGIALLAVAVLGGVLLMVLGDYYARSEDAYLRASADRIAGDPPPLEDEAALAYWVQLAALTTQTRVRVVASDGAVLADSGSPRELDPGAVVSADDGEHRPGGPGGRERLPEPLGRGLFGGADTSTSRSDRTLLVEVAGADGAAIQLSEAPASGGDALVGVAQAWGVAAALAVVLAALVGYLVSSRISRPVVALTDASDRMAEGDLSARAPVAGEDEIGKLGESFNAMAARIETTVVALRRFVADAAHEVGTPLTALQADLELAERAAVSDDERRLVERALDQARRLESLSGNLLQLSRIEADTAPGEIAPVDVGALAREIAGEVASRAEQAGVQLEIDIDDAPLVVAAAPSDIRTVLANLLDNAVKFTGEGGTVTIGCHPQGGIALLTVSDTGVGIPETEQDRVFSRFHRARNVAAYPGSGLGLAIVKATVERIGGSIAFESSDRGTEFRVMLPLL